MIYVFIVKENRLVLSKTSFADLISSDEVALEALQMDTVEWNPGEMIAGVHKSSPENESDSYNPATSEVVFRNDSFELEARKLDSQEEMARHFELIRRRQSQYTPLQSLTHSPPDVNLNPKVQRIVNLVVRKTQKSINHSRQFTRKKSCGKL